MVSERDASTSQERTARERIVYAAAQQLRAVGPTAASLRTIVRQAQAPWGSLRHYFPGGKAQILSEALAWSGDYAATDVTEYLQSANPTPGGLFVHLLDIWARDLKRCDFGRGCPVAAATLDPGETATALTGATRAAMDSWLAAIEHALSATGVTTAASQARTMLSMLEGAIIISRAQKSTTALSELRQFAAHFDAAAQPERRSASNTKTTPARRPQSRQQPRGSGQETRSRVSGVPAVRSGRRAKRATYPADPANAAE